MEGPILPEPPSRRSPRRSSVPREREVPFMTETNRPASAPAPQPSGMPPRPPEEEPMGPALAIAQFAVTAVLLGLVATLAYLAGMRSAGKEGGEGSSASASKPGGTVNVAALLKPTPEL